MTKSIEPKAKTLIWLTMADSFNARLFKTQLHILNFIKCTYIPNKLIGAWNLHTNIDT